MITGGYVNTLLYMSTGTLLNLFLTSLGAYVLSRGGSCCATRSCSSSW